MSHLSLQMYNHRNKNIIEIRAVKDFSPHLKWPYWIFLPDFDIVVFLEWQTSNSQTPGTALKIHLWKEFFCLLEFGLMWKVWERKEFFKNMFLVSWFPVCPSIWQTTKGMRLMTLKRFSLMWLRYIQDFWRLLRENIIRSFIFTLFFFSLSFPLNPSIRKLCLLRG